MREAEGLGAEGVVGVRLVVRSWEWAQGMAEFTVLGTAVRRDGGPPPTRPFTSTLSGQDMAKLATTGQRPLGVALGASAWTAMAFFGGLMGGMATWSNQEVSSFSRALHLAQHQSRARMAAEASALGGQGGMLRRNKQVRRILIQLGEDRFEVAREQGAVLARRVRVVRGIALKTEELAVDPWLAELSQALLREGQSTSEGRIALERLLG